MVIRITLLLALILVLGCGKKKADSIAPVAKSESKQVHTPTNQEPTPSSDWVEFKSKENQFSVQWHEANPDIRRATNSAGQPSTVFKFTQKNNVATKVQINHNSSEYMSKYDIDAVILEIGNEFVKTLRGTEVETGEFSLDGEYCREFKCRYETNGKPMTAVLRIVQVGNTTYCAYGQGPTVNGQHHPELTRFISSFKYLRAPGDPPPMAHRMWVELKSAELKFSAMFPRPPKKSLVNYRDGKTYTNEVIMGNSTQLDVKITVSDIFGKIDESQMSRYLEMRALSSIDKDATIIRKEVIEFGGSPCFEILFKYKDRKSGLDLIVRSRNSVYKGNYYWWYGMSKDNDGSTLDPDIDKFISHFKYLE